MGNAKEAVKQAADNVTVANDAAGIPFELLKQGLRVSYSSALRITDKLFDLKDIIQLR